MGRTKTTDAEDASTVVMACRAVRDLQEWLGCAGITRGAIFRRIDRWGRIGLEPLSPQSVNLILKRRVAEAGLDPDAFSAHGLPAGYLTEAALRGLSLPEAMVQSGHRSATEAARYFNASGGQALRAAKLLE